MVKGDIAGRPRRVGKWQIKRSIFKSGLPVDRYEFQAETDDNISKENEWTGYHADGSRIENEIACRAGVSEARNNQAGRAKHCYCRRKRWKEPEFHGTYIDKILSRRIVLCQNCCQPRFGGGRPSAQRGCSVSCENGSTGGCPIKRRFRFSEQAAGSTGRY